MDQNHPAPQQSGPIRFADLGLKALVAEDQPCAAYLAVHVLKLMGCPVRSVAKSSDELVRAVKREHVELVVLDLVMPGSYAPLELLQCVMELSDAPVIVYSSLDAPLIVAEVLRRGARSFVSKNSGAGALVDAIRQTACGASFIDPLVSGRDIHPWTTLTDAERSIAAAIFGGSSLKAVAIDTNRHYNTVHGLLARTMQKLHVRNETELVRYMFGEGIHHLLARKHARH